MNWGDQLRAEIQALQQQLNEKDYELETHENEIESYKKELESHNRRASEAACEAAAEQAQYLEEKKSLDDFKRSVEKQRCLAQFLTDPAIMKHRFDTNNSRGQPVWYVLMLRLQWIQERESLEAGNAC